MLSNSHRAELKIETIRQCIRLARAHNRSVIEALREHKAFSARLARRARCDAMAAARFIKEMP